MKKSDILFRFSLIPIATIIIALMVLSGCQPQPPREEADIEDPVIPEEVPEDMGRQPWVLDIERETIENLNYREAKWTGEYLQMVFMSLKPGEVIDLEVHEDHDQFIRIEQGEAHVRMGETRESLLYDEMVYDDWAVFIPAGYWHQVRNTGDTDLKLYTIYAPSEHPSGIIHETYEDTEGYEH